LYTGYKSGIRGRGSNFRYGFTVVFYKRGGPEPKYNCPSGSEYTCKEDYGLAQGP